MFVTWYVCAFVSVSLRVRVSVPVPPSTDRAAGNATPAAVASVIRSGPVPAVTVAASKASWRAIDNVLAVGPEPVVRVIESPATVKSAAVAEVESFNRMVSEPLPPVTEIGTVTPAAGVRFPMSPVPTTRVSAPAPRSNERVPAAATRLAPVASVPPLNRPVYVMFGSTAPTVIDPPVMARV